MHLSLTYFIVLVIGSSMMKAFNEGYVRWVSQAYACGLSGLIK